MSKTSLTIPKGKGSTLAFFLVFICMQILAVPDCWSQTSNITYPVINRLDPTDIGFRQFLNDVHANRRRLVSARTRVHEAVDNLTIFQYTTRPGEDIFFLAARCNIPYSTLASLNRLNNPTALTAGQVILLPSCPGIFIPPEIESDLEKIIGAARQNNEDAVELRISISGRSQVFHFIPGADYSPTERGFFLYSGFRFPLRTFRLTSPYGIREDPITGHIAMHRGIDLAAPEGTEVYAAADGTVTAIGEDPVYGIYIIINHSNNWTSFYAHLQRAETVLRSEVKSDTLIGRVGTTGLSTGPHLHFELRQNGMHFDPGGRLRP